MAAAAVPEPMIHCHREPEPRHDFSKSDLSVESRGPLLMPGDQLDSQSSTATTSSSIAEIVAASFQLLSWLLNQRGSEPR
jgi:hypothetical protein